MRVSNDGPVYVADRANNRVQVFTLDGRFISPASAADSKGNIYTAETEDSRSRRFVLQGTDVAQPFAICDL